MIIDINNNKTFSFTANGNMFTARIEKDEFFTIEYLEVLNENGEIIINTILLHKENPFENIINNVVAIYNDNEGVLIINE